MKWILILVSILAPECLFFSFQFIRGLEFIPRLVISNKGPVENGDWASKHSLHWAFGHALSNGRPDDGHRLWATHITIDDWWLHTSRSIGLHPPVNSEGKARQLFSKVLNHIIPLQWKAPTISSKCNFSIINQTRQKIWQEYLVLQKEYARVTNVSTIPYFHRLIFSHNEKMRAYLRLSMYQYINIKLFLKFNNFADFLLNCCNILFLGDPEENSWVSPRRYMVNKTRQISGVSLTFQPCIHGAPSSALESEGRIQWWWLGGLEG